MKDKLNKIHNMDCLKFMRDVPDNYFDLVLTDPPYGIGASSSNFTRQGKQTGASLAISGRNYKHSDWDKKIPTKEIFEEIKRVSKNQIIFGGNYFIEYLNNSSCWLVWDKLNGDNLYADCELAWTNFKTAVRKYEFRWHGMLQQDMANKEVRHHPTQKPTELFKHILRDYAKEGFKIFDPFMGSGTTALACKGLSHMNLEWCGCEVEPDYVAIANKRLEAVQGSLF